jgi:hypothetical protein
MLVITRDFLKFYSVTPRCIFFCELLLKTNNREKLIGEDWHITNTNKETADYQCNTLELRGVGLVAGTGRPPFRISNVE